ncbi:ESCRT-III subunit protein snf7 [Friedmanniomyces endolithicus]|nr:ESCRT-III subunit protein snf7 [Friedmanniomyces endolithicus]
MKTIHGGLAIDKVDQTMEDLRELHANGEEISEALAQGNVGQGVDEKEPDERLAELFQRIPAVSTWQISNRHQQVAEDEEVEELRNLQAKMAM